MHREFDVPSLSGGVKAGTIEALELCLGLHQRDLAKQSDANPTDLALLRFAAAAEQTYDTNDRTWVLLSEENLSEG